MHSSIIGLERRVHRRQLLGGALAAAALPAITWPVPAAAAEPLVVGGLAVTCSLTLPVACAARAVANRADKSGKPQFAFEYSKYNGWPEVKESLMSGGLQAAFMLAPLVMDLADKKIPIKIVSLGHRSGAVTARGLLRYWLREKIYSALPKKLRQKRGRCHGADTVDHSSLAALGRIAYLGLQPELGIRSERRSGNGAHHRPGAGAARPHLMVAT